MMQKIFSPTLVDITSIKPFQFDYVTKLLALAKQIDDMAMTLSLQVESKLAMASLRELKGAPKQFEDPAEFCALVFKDYLKKGDLAWLKPIDAFFFIDTEMSQSARTCFDDYFGKVVDDIRLKILDSSVAFKAFIDGMHDLTINKACRLAKMGEVSFSFENEPPYLYYAKKILTSEGIATLAVYEEDPNKALQGLLKFTNHPLSEYFYVDADHVNLFALAWSNFYSHGISQASVDMKVFALVSDFRSFAPKLNKVWSGYKRGSFARLIWMALDEADRFDIEKLEFDRGFCSLLAVAVDEIEAYPESFQIEFFRMCHYAGFSYETELYDFSEPCDYATRDYQDEPTLVDDIEGIESAIQISENPFVVYRVSYDFANEDALARLPLTFEALGYVQLRELVDCFDSEDFDTFEEAKERAQEIERQRREQYLSISAGRTDVFHELLHWGPKVTIQPVLVEDDDFA